MRKKSNLCQEYIVMGNMTQVTLTMHCYVTFKDGGPLHPDNLLAKKSLNVCRDDFSVAEFYCFLYTYMYVTFRALLRGAAFGPSKLRWVSTRNELKIGDWL
jgi:hypothetical protein